METTKVRLRRTFAPMNVATSLVCDTNENSPIRQVYDAATNSYSPDRSLSPCLIRPLIQLDSSDGSVKQAIGNAYLAQMHWYVNDEEISTLSAWAGKYSINQNIGNSRGTLTITRNIPVGERCELKFKGVITDVRTNDNITVEAGPLLLVTTDKSEDDWQLSLRADPTFQYDPLRDNLLLYNYEVSHGLRSFDADDEAAANDVTSFRYTVPVEVRKSTTLVTSGYTLELYRVDHSTGTATLIDPAADDNEIISMSLTGIMLDLRLVESEQYLLIMKVGGVEKSRGVFHVERKYGSYRLAPVNDTGVGAMDEIRHDIVQGFYEGNVLTHPACAIRILWKTKSQNGREVLHNEGETTVYNLEEAGLGQDYLTAELDQWLESEQKGRYAFAKDGNDNELWTDELGNVLIFN